MQYICYLLRITRQDGTPTIYIVILITLRLKRNPLRLSLPPKTMMTFLLVRRKLEDQRKQRTQVHSTEMESLEVCKREASPSLGNANDSR